MDIPVPMRLSLFISLPLVVSLIGCGKSDPKKKTLNLISGNSEIIISKLPDISFPLGYKIITSSIKDTTQYMESTGNMNLEQLTTFYKRSMEEQGWNIKLLITEHEGLLICSKPFRLCTVSLRPSLDKKNYQKNIASVHLFIQYGTMQEKAEGSLRSSNINGKSIV